MEATILRLGHRIARDKRMTTHVALTARALGASNMVYTGMRDKNIESNLLRINKDWGGKFKITYTKKYSSIIKKWKQNGGIIVHLTMFGIELGESLEEIKTKLSNEKKILIILGGAKVSAEIYQLSDYNIAIGNQPHSEVAALAVFLDHITEGKARKKKFSNANIEIIPQRKGKRTKKMMEVNYNEKDNSIREGI